MEKVVLLDRIIYIVNDAEISDFSSFPYFFPFIYIIQYVHTRMHKVYVQFIP